MFTEQNGPRKMNTALYGRTSRDDPRTVTIEIQQRMLTEWATRDPWVARVVEGYWDEGVSGKIPLWDRPAGKRLMEDVKSGKIEAVAVAYADRFGRTLKDGLEAVDRLGAAGVKLVTVNEGWDGRLNHDPMWFHLRMVFAEEDHRRTCTRLRDGKERSMREKESPPTAVLVFGYSSDDNGRYILDPVEAPVVIEVFRRCLAGEPNEEILRWVKTLGVVAGRKYRRREAGQSPFVAAVHEGAEWHGSRISRILRNRVYLGERKWGERMFSHPPLIDQASFDRVQEILATRVRIYKPNRAAKGQALLSGLLTCETCGGRFYYYHKPGRHRGRGKEVYPMYACTTMHTRLNCKAKLLPVADVDSKVWTLIESFLADPEEVVRKVIAQGEDLSGRCSALREEEDGLVRQIESLDHEAASIWEQQKQGGWPLSWVAPQLNALVVKKDGLTSALATCRQRLAAISLTKEETEQVTAALAGIRAQLAGGLTAEDKQRIVRLMVAEGSVKTIGSGRGKKAEVTVVLRWGEGCSIESLRSLDRPTTPRSEREGSQGLPVVFTFSRRDAG